MKSRLKKLLRHIFYWDSPAQGAFFGLTLAIVGTWLLLSRWVIPRLGPGARGLSANRIAVWTCAATFLAAWYPFNNGLRPEPVIAFGVIATWVLVEYAIATRRLAPAALALMVAGLAATTAPDSRSSQITSMSLTASAPSLCKAGGKTVRHPSARRPPP